MNRGCCMLHISDLWYLSNIIEYEIELKYFEWPNYGQKYFTLPWVYLKCVQYALVCIWMCGSILNMLNCQDKQMGKLEMNIHHLVHTIPHMTISLVCSIVLSIIMSSFCASPNVRLPPLTMLNLRWSQRQFRRGCTKIILLSNQWMSETERTVHLWAAVPPQSNTAVLGGRGDRGSTVTCTMLCGMSEAAVRTVSLIYQDKCKHVKSQPLLLDYKAEHIVNRSTSLMGTRPANAVFNHLPWSLLD